LTFGERAISKIREWRADPVKFAWDNFQFEGDDWQVEVLKLLPSMDPKHQRLSMQAAAGVGKSAILSIAGWYFLSCYGRQNIHPKAAALSITGQNLKDNLWAELSKFRSMSPFLMNAFEWTQSRVFAKDHPETWFMSARSFSQSANAEEIGRTLSGLHSDYVFYLIDESGDIPVSVLKAAEQGLSTKPLYGKILQAGNPTSHGNMLHAASTSLRDQWHVTRITSDPDDPKRSKRTDPVWAREQINKHGRDSPWVMSYLLGQFPNTSINTLLSPHDVEEAMNRAVTEDQYNWSQKRLGVDVARFGMDSTIIFPRQGLVAFQCVEMRGARTQEISARVALAKQNWKSEMEFIDGTGGFGSGVIDSLGVAGYSPIEIHFSGKPMEMKYANKRAEMWFNMAAWIKKGGVLPNDPILAKELTAPTYFFKDGKLQLEDKEQIKKRLGFSPDRADALALTFAYPDEPAMTSLEALVARAKGSNKVLTEFDPYRDL